MNINDMYQYLKDYIDKRVYLAKTTNLEPLFQEYKTKEVGENINSVLDVGNDLTNINNVNDHIDNIDTVAPHVDNIDTAAIHINNVDINANNINNINTVGSNINDVNIAADNIVNINDYAKTYLGAKSIDPTTRNDNSSLQQGDMYFNTEQKIFKVWTGLNWLEQRGGQFADLNRGIGYTNNKSDSNENIIIYKGQNAFSIEEYILEDNTTLNIEDGAVYKIL